MEDQTSKSGFKSLRELQGLQGPFAVSFSSDDVGVSRSQVFFILDYLKSPAENKLQM